MAKFGQIIITENGQALVAKMLAGATGVQFLNVLSSSEVYAPGAVEALTALANIRQTVAVTQVERTGDTTVKVSGIIPNTALAAGYTCSTIGVTAEDPDDGEILFAVAIVDLTMAGNAPDFVAPYDGATNTSLIIDMSLAVGNAAAVLLTVTTAGIATVVQLNNHINDKSNPHEVTYQQAGADRNGAATLMYQTVIEYVKPHIDSKSNPHEVTYQQVGADQAGAAGAVQTNLTAHVNDNANPHGVTASQVGADASGSAATVQTNLTAHTTLTNTAHGATVYPTANTLIARDINGRTQIADPVAANEAANKGYTDGRLWNPNILDNSDFRNTVNQRGANTYGNGTDGQITIDRWRKTSGGATGMVYVFSGSRITLYGDPSSGLWLHQNIEPSIAQWLIGKTCTVTIELEDGSIYTMTAPFPGDGATEYYIGLPGGSSRIYNLGNNDYRFQFYVYQGQYMYLRRCKLEIGSVSTLANDPPMDYNAEMLKCLKYLQYLRSVALRAVNIPSSGADFQYSLVVPMRSVPQYYGTSVTQPLFQPSPSLPTLNLSILSADNSAWDAKSRLLFGATVNQAHAGQDCVLLLSGYLTAEI